MAKFGLFFRGNPEPYAEYEGKSISADKQFVRIHGEDTIADPDGPIVAAIHLEPGYYISKISN